MSPAEIKEVILDILGDIAPDEDLSELKDDVPLREQLELDSMDFLDIVMELRKRYRVQIPEDDYVELASMQSTVRYLEPLMRDIAPAKS
ncbi:MAG TPA: acyl carrier protein [Pirellulales bacterium]|jgi:acyl carrier protein|nr:acyl carrier protein [Pirellulales bacterium]